MIACALGAMLVGQVGGAPPAAQETDAAGAGQPRVVFVSPPEEVRWSAAEERGHRETVSLGFEVALVDGQAADDEGGDAELEAAAAAQGAVAAVRIRRASDRGLAELWCPERSGGEMVHRRIEVPGPPTEHRAKVVGLRIAEALNVGLFELRFAAKQLRREPGVVVVPPAEGLESLALRSATPEAPSRLELRGGAGMALLPGEGTVTVGPLLGANWRIDRRWVAGVEVFVTASASTLRREEAQAAVRAGMARLALMLEPWPDAWLSPAVSLGGGVLVVWASGTVPEPDVGQTQAQVVALGSAGPSLGLRLSKRVQVRAAFQAGLALPSVAINFGTQTLARVGRPFFDGSLGLVAAF